MGEEEMDLLDVPYDFDTLMKIGTMSGSGAIMSLTTAATSSSASPI